MEPVPVNDEKRREVDLERPEPDRLLSSVRADSKFPAEVQRGLAPVDDGVEVHACVVRRGLLQRSLVEGLQE